MSLFQILLSFLWCGVLAFILYSGHCSLQLVCTILTVAVVKQVKYVQLLKVCEWFLIKCCSNIRVVPVGMSKAVKKLVKGHVPNLASYSDISDFVLR